MTSVVRHETRPLTAEEIERRGKLALAEAKARNTLIVRLAGQSWGDGMTPRQQLAFAEYMRRFNLDVGEVDNMGGRPYKNGNYYKRRIAEMRTEGIVEWSEGYHIGPDERLQELYDAGDAWGMDEFNKRLRERIKWAVPQDATHAYVTRVKLKNDEKVIEGCDWITPARTKKVRKWMNGRRTNEWEDKIADPVGAEEPEKTVITRAWRRVGLVAAAEIPGLKAQEEAMEVAAIMVEEQVEKIGAEEAERDASAQLSGEPIASATADDPYGHETTATAPAGRTSAPQAEPVRGEQRPAGGNSSDEGDAGLPDNFWDR